MSSFNTRITIFIFAILITHVFVTLPNGCDENKTYGFVYCSNVSFHDTIEHFRGLTLDSLDFTYCSEPIGRLQSLPPINLKEFTINYCGITEIDDAVFADVSVMPDVEVLDFAYNNITKVPSFGVKPYLTNIKLRHNLLTEINDSAFSGSRLLIIDNFVFTQTLTTPTY
uniref:Recep_L_domain domain-containing protein n=1 Tax=Panagrellus redivivus TaxID=6233 RepID=A0A7E4V678_PANRE